MTNYTFQYKELRTLFSFQEISVGDSFTTDGHSIWLKVSPTHYFSFQTRTLDTHSESTNQWYRKIYKLKLVAE
jgi:hypothetical protein